MANVRIGPSPAPTSGNKGHFCVQGDAAGYTYDGTLCTGEVFVANRDTGVCSRWDGSTKFARGVTLQVPNLVTSTGAPVTLGAAPADGQPVTFCEFGVVGIKTTCTADAVLGGAPFKASNDGTVITMSVTDATGTDKQVARAVDERITNSAGGAFHWFFWTGYLLNTNDVTE